MKPTSARGSIEGVRHGVPGGDGSVFGWMRRRQRNSSCARANVQGWAVTRRLTRHGSNITLLSKDGHNGTSSSRQRQSSSASRARQHALQRQRCDRSSRTRTAWRRRLARAQCQRRKWRGTAACVPAAQYGAACQQRGRSGSGSKRAGVQQGSRPAAGAAEQAARCSWVHGSSMCCGTCVT
jgi:hypothetical protein